jgi:hypothetical protein
MEKCICRIDHQIKWTIIATVLTGWSTTLIASANCCLVVGGDMIYFYKNNSIKNCDSDGPDTKDF